MKNLIMRFKKFKNDENGMEFLQVAIIVLIVAVIAVLILAIGAAIKGIVEKASTKVSAIDTSGWD